MTTPVIRSQRLVLDEVRPSDVTDVFTACQDDELQRWVPLPSPYERTDAEFFTGPYASDAATSTAFGLWAIRLAESPTLIGAIELRFEPLGSATVGFWLARPHRGRGVMTEALQTLVEFAFDPEGFDLDRMHWQAVAHNVASAIVARRNGFRFEGVSRLGIVHRGRRIDAWEATLLRADLTANDTGAAALGWPL